MIIDLLGRGREGGTIVPWDPGRVCFRLPELLRFVRLGFGVEGGRVRERPDSAGGADCL